MADSRESVIRQLLERHEELVNPLQPRAGTGDGAAVPLMPETYTRSVRELERLLRVMRDDRSSPLLTTGDGEKCSVRRAWWHVNAWYLTASVVLVVPPKIPRSKRKAPQRLMLTTDGRRLPVRVVHRDLGARQHLAALGVRWLAEQWGKGDGSPVAYVAKGGKRTISEPMLPGALLEDAA